MVSLTTVGDCGSHECTISHVLNGLSSSENRDRDLRIELVELVMKICKGGEALSPKFHHFKERFRDAVQGYTDQAWNTVR